MDTRGPFKQLSRRNNKTDKKKTSKECNDTRRIKIRNDNCYKRVIAECRNSRGTVYYNELLKLDFAILCCILNVENKNSTNANKKVK